MRKPGKSDDELFYEKYGITYKDRNLMARKQAWKCKICGVYETQCPKKLAVDHNHATGKVRGLLCQSCNSLLAYAKDNPKILESAIKYIKRTEV
jgi:hypothetical protein